MEEQHSFCLWSAGGGSNQSTTNQNKRVAQSNVIRPNNSDVVAGRVFSISYKGEKAEFILGKVATDSLCRTSAKKTASVPPEFLCILPLLYCRTYCLCLKVAKWNEEKSQRPSAQTFLNFTPEISLHLWEWESDRVLYWLMVISWWCHKEQRTCICCCPRCPGGSGSRPQHFITSPMLIITSRGSSFYIYNHLDRSQRRDVKSRALFWFCSTSVPYELTNWSAALCWCCSVLSKHCVESLSEEQRVINVLGVALSRLRTRVWMGVVLQTGCSD